MDDRTKSTWLYFAKWILLILGILLLLIVAIDQLRNAVTQFMAPEILVAAVALIFGCIVLESSRRVYRKWTKVHYGGRSPGRPLVDQYSPDVKKAAISQTLDEIEGMEYDPELFFDMLRQPHRFIERVVEEAEIRDQCLRLKASLTLNIPRRRRGRKIVIPILWIQKGIFLDNFDVEDSEGHSIPILPLARSRGLLTVTTLRALRAIYPPVPPRIADDYEAAARTVLNHIWTIGTREILPLTPLQQLRDVFIRNSEAWRLHKQLSILCEMLKGYYPLIAEVKRGSRIIIKTSKTVPLFQQRGDRVKDRLLGPIRFLMGSKPRIFNLPLHWPHLAAEYHFRMQGEPGRYVSAHYLRNLNNEGAPALRVEDVFPPPGPPDKTPRPYVRIRYKSGLPYAHLYIRGLDMVSQPPRMSTVVEFAEVPPGTLGLATGASVFTTALIALFSQSPFDNNVNNFPSFLLTFAVLAVSWLGFAADKDSLLRAPLTARVGILYIILASLSAVLLRTIQPPWAKSRNVFLSFWGVPMSINFWWLVLVGMSIYVSLHLLIVFAARCYRYRKLVRQWESSAKNLGEHMAP
ncbi:hypothetical protein [Nonomuraea maheshkhaliensis]|uniref:hypothetical protein n=1 Tax=Nonomuraea maheshkhaliensis TaxID=419590 RepID=UPI0031F72861